MTTLERVRDGFPNPNVELIVGQTGYETIKALQMQLNANAAFIHTHWGNGRLGLLLLTVQPAVYNKLYNLSFVPPVNPGPAVTYPNNPNQHQIIAVNKLHKINTRFFKQYDTCNRAIKQLLLGAVDDMFVNVISNPHVGCANVTTLKFITHLYDKYVRITDRDLEKNKELMAQACGVNLLIGFVSIVLKIVWCMPPLEIHRIPPNKLLVLHFTQYSKRECSLMMWKYGKDYQQFKNMGTFQN